MAVRNLTDRFLRSVKPGSQRQEIADTDTKGLYLVVQPSGTTSWAFRYRRGGKPTKLTIGNYPAISLADARKAVRSHRALLDQHQDPRAIQRAEKARVGKEERPGNDSVSAWFDRYLADFKRRTRSRSYPEVKRRGDAIKAAIGRKHIALVTSSEIKIMMNEIGADKPIHANRTFETCRAFYNWLIDEQAISNNPCTGLKKFEEQSRERVLDWDEFVIVWRSVEKLGYPFGHAIRMMMLTGQRRDEVSGMRWKEINGRGEWTIPGERTKNANKHVLPLPDAAFTIINSIPRIGEHVFTTTGRTAISGWSKVKARLDEDCPLSEPWRLHDLRRTFATGLAEIGVAQQVTEALLNHVSGEKGGLAGIYNRYEYRAEMHTAMRAWSRFIDVIIDNDLRMVYLQMVDHTAFKIAINSDSVAWEHQIRRMRAAISEPVEESA